MVEKLISISDPKLLQSGIVKSLHKLSAPLWIDGQNVIFEDGAVRKSSGYIKAFESLAAEPICGMQDVLIGNIANLCFGDNDNLYRYNGTAVTADGTGYSGSISREAFQVNAFQDAAFQLATSPQAALWSMTDWGTWCIATNNIDPPQINKMTGAGFVNLTGSPPTRARIVIRYKTFVVFFNTDLGGNFAEWCDVDNVEDYTSGAAGNLAIRDLDSEIQAVAPLGDSLAIYSNNQVVQFQYIGPDFWFGTKPLLKGIGATGIFSVIPKGSQNFGISRQGVWLSDGVSYDYVSPPYIRDWIQDNVNFSKGEKIAGYLNEDRSMVEWGVPINGASDNNITICYNYENRSWTFRNYGIACALKKNAFVLPIFGMADGGIYFAEYGLNADTGALESWVQSKPLSGDDHFTWKDIEALVSYISKLQGTGVKLYLGVQESLTDALHWSSAISAQEASDLQFLDQGEMLSGRYISIKVYSNGIDDNWKLAGFDIWGSKTGYNI